MQDMFVGSVIVATPCSHELKNAPEHITSRIGEQAHINSNGANIIGFFSFYSCCSTSIDNCCAVMLIRVTFRARMGT